MNKSIKRVLMCRPLYYTVEYVINPWMKPGTVDQKKAFQQWNNLVSTYKSLGIQIEVIDQIKDLPDMVFATDQGIVYEDKKVLMSNFRYPERQGEREPYLQWFQDHGFKTNFIFERYNFEGNGECVEWNEKIFLGVGFRSTEEAGEKIAEVLKKEVISLTLVDPSFYHVDTCLFPLNEEIVFYYPPAFSPDSEKLLKTSIPQLIPFTKEEAFSFAANSIVTGNHVIVQSGNETFVKKIKGFGYEPIELDLGEYVKAGGGIHCLTNVLE